MANSAYRINYFLRSHKRDVFIEFVKSLVHTPFAIHARPITSAQIVENYLHCTDAAEKKRQVKEEEQEEQVTKLLREKYAEVMTFLEGMIEEHRMEQDKATIESRLQALVPSIGRFFTTLPLRQSFLIEDEKMKISARRHVPMSFNDIRKILNRAQVLAVVDGLKLITFDGDMTLYDDGQNFEHDSHLVSLLISLLLQPKLHVAIVTAAGYTEGYKYEARLSGLLKGFKKANLGNEVVQKFWVMGGECNYLFNCTASYTLQSVPVAYNPNETSHRYLHIDNPSITLPPFSSPALPLSPALVPVANPINPSANGNSDGFNLNPNMNQPLVTVTSESDTKLPEPQVPCSSPPAGSTSTASSYFQIQTQDQHEKNQQNQVYTTAEVNDLLNVAERVLNECQQRLQLNAKVIRKERAVGIVSLDGGKLGREQLDEIVLTSQHVLLLYQNHVSSTSGKKSRPPIPFCAF
ncbi:IMP-specific 5'-nucleotidase-domain-containing protein, partial [Paraphysoderma sedebokerense]